MPARPDLSDLTLVCVDGLNHAAAIRAMARCLDACRFGAAIFVTDRPVEVPPGVELRVVGPIDSRATCARVRWRVTADEVGTSHLLVVQWDGFVVDPGAWDPAFLGYDYIGACWPVADGAAVGNGGFSLRSRRLSRLVRDLPLQGLPEDVAICRLHRPRLEQEHGLRFAEDAVADRFSFERVPPSRGRWPGG